MNTTTILQSEFEERIRRFQANIKNEGLDACLVHATESDMAHVRYLSEYWPTFETAAVFVPVEGEPVLLVGPESDLYASHRSFFKHIEKMKENIAGVLQMPKENVNIKATTEEGLGFTGNGEGISSKAITLLTTVNDYCYDDTIMTGNCNSCGGCCKK